jgi:RNA-directed DNA polymerase
MGPIQRGDTVLYAKKGNENPAMETGLERLAAKAKSDSKLVFTSLAHHVSKELLWRSLCCLPKRTSAGVDGQSVEAAKENFEAWAPCALTAIHRRGYKAPAVRRVYIPKPGRSDMRPIGVPTVADRAVQRSVSTVLSQIYEQDFLPCSFGGRPQLSAHHALSTFNEIVAGKKVSMVLECDIKNFFGSLDHTWVVKFLTHRINDPRIITLIQRWLKAGVLEDGVVRPSEEGTPQGGSISVLLSNIYLHYALDLWFKRIVKPRMRGESYLIRYLDDFLICFQYPSDAKRVYAVLPKRLGKFGLQLEPTKTKLVAFGRFAARDSKLHGTKLEAVDFLGFSHFCTRNRKGNFQVGRKTAKKWQARSMAHLTRLMGIIRHRPIREQVAEINQVLRGHYLYYGLGGNFGYLQRMHRFCEWRWRRMLCRRSQRGNVTWEKFQRIKAVYPLCAPRLHVPYSRMQALAVL